MANFSKKRRPTTSEAPPAKRARFPPNLSRNLASAATSTTYPNGELNVARFMRAHEYEIKQLEKAMKDAKNGLSRRAFQDVPRDLRRRTGSHNPQRVPKRLRQQARKEAKEDNTPISKGKSGSGVGKGNKSWLRKESIKKKKKAKEKRERIKEQNEVLVTIDRTVRTGRKHEVNSGEDLKRTISQKHREKLAALASPDTPPSRFRRRQVHKTWLPTHLFHTKRATMTPPKEPLWRFALPLSPANKTYRAFHRASSQRGAIAWDMSYLATIGLEAVEGSIKGLLQALHFAKEDGGTPWLDSGKGRKWRDGVQVWEGWIYEREGSLTKHIAPATVIWSVPDPKTTKRKAFMRVHPSAFLRLWNETIRVAKVQKPAVAVEDLRFEVGSIEVMGPAAAEALCSILTPSGPPKDTPNTDQYIWSTLAPITDIETLPPNAILAFPISDPRLRHPPRSANLSYDDASQAQLTEILAQWPMDQRHNAGAIFDRNTRLAAQRSLPSQQSINRRMGAAIPGEYPTPRPTDPQIPMLTYTSSSTRTWTVLLPWKCINPVWKCLMHYPISTGGNPRFGGLKQRKQVNYERSKSSFPFDRPGTDAGWEWELLERAERKIEWTKRPKGRRIEWTSIDLGKGRKGEIGDPWACAWEQLIPAQVDRIVKPAQKATQVATSFRQSLCQQVSAVMADSAASTGSLTASPRLFIVKIAMVQRGVPTTCARIYRLPTADAKLREKWLSLLPGSKPTTASPKAEIKLNKRSAIILPKQLRVGALAASLLRLAGSSAESTKAGDDEYPVVPDEEDLIGFVTTGNFNLAEGRPTAIANLALHRVIEAVSKQAGDHGKVLPKERHVCIVREAGQSLGRLATWEIVA